ncbi:hypothetical protein DHX103_06465 [Planococcus sp. X10-3]|uniref:hypothetical protein n=1 Tax=Planococcus sp. X10-3 TaxID=3061240 RepID=UPI003BAED9AA
MMKSKAAMAVGSMVGTFIIIYGTTAVFGLLFGAYLFEGGLTNVNYGVLAVLCGAPFAVVALIGRNGKVAQGAVILSAILFFVIFILVHLVLVLSAEAMEVRRVMAIFPISALLLVVVLYFTREREKAV